MADDLLSVYYFIVATAGIVSIIFALLNWRKDRPIIKPIIHRCSHERAEPTWVTVNFEVKNVGHRPTSLNELQLRVLDGSTKLHGLLMTLKEVWQLAAIMRPYRPEMPPKDFVDLPITVEAGSTALLIADFRLDGTITHSVVKCILTISYTHGEKTVKCWSPSILVQLEY